MRAVLSAVLVSAVTATAVHAASVDYVFKGLGTLGGRFSYALDINNAGQVVGYSSTSDYYIPTYHAVLWSNGVTTDLHVTSNSTKNSSATAINNRGQIVGTIDDAAVQWEKLSSSIGSPTLAYRHKRLWRNFRNQGYGFLG